MIESAIQHRAAKSWVKIAVEADSRMTEAIAAYLADLSGCGVEISSSGEGTFHTLAQPANLEKITAYIPVALSSSAEKTATEKTHELREFLDKLSCIFSDCPSPRLSIETIVEEDWGQLWKSFFSTFQITPLITIRPSWENAKEQGQQTNTDQFVIEMDPGLAFGTGHHESTQLALLLLEELFQHNKETLRKVLDVGTGSGILAMGCGLFGAAEVLAIDNDPDAVETARKNISSNRLEQVIRVSDQDIRSLEPGFTLIVANIIHDTLADMSKHLCDFLAPGGFLILSGILEGEQEESIRRIYVDQGLHFIKSATKGEWAALEFKKE